MIIGDSVITDIITMVIIIIGSDSSGCIGRSSGGGVGCSNSSRSRRSSSKKKRRSDSGCVSDGVGDGGSNSKSSSSNSNNSGSGCGSSSSFIPHARTVPGPASLRSDSTATSMPMADGSNAEERHHRFQWITTSSFINYQLALSPFGAKTANQ